MSRCFSNLWDVFKIFKRLRDNFAYEQTEYISLHIKYILLGFWGDEIQNILNFWLSEVHNPSSKSLNIDNRDLFCSPPFHWIIFQQLQEFQPWITSRHVIYSSSRHIGDCCVQFYFTYRGDNENPHFFGKLNFCHKLSFFCLSFYQFLSQYHFLKPDPV